jgi:hypothetical protein
MPLAFVEIASLTISSHVYVDKFLAVPGAVTSFWRRRAASWVLKSSLVIGKDVVASLQVITKYGVQQLVYKAQK